MLLVEHRRHRGRHRAEVHRDVLGLHDHLALGVEEGGGGVAALLDVRRVRRAHQHGAHLVTGRAQAVVDAIARHESDVAAELMTDHLADLLTGLDLTPTQRDEKSLSDILN